MKFKAWVTISSLFTIIFSGILLSNCKHNKNTDNEIDIIKNNLLNEVDGLRNYVQDSLLVIAKSEKIDTIKLKQNFINARYKFKKVEWAVEYYMASTSKEINGPPLDEIEVEENTAFSPQGFQVIEQYIFPNYSPENKPEIIRQLISLVSSCDRVKKYLPELTFTKSQIFDALKQELFRIITLGISGFDAPITLNSLPEAAISLESILSTINLCENIFPNDEKNYSQIKNQLNDAIKFCKSQNDFNAFDRAGFITENINPICKTLSTLVNNAKLGYEIDLRLLNANAITLFDSGAFNFSAFIPSLEYNFTKEKAGLGKILFNSNIFSVTGNRSCATCHKEEKAFTDGLAKSVSLKGSNLLRNAPSLNYAGLQHAQFWDLRQSTLEGQAMNVIANRDEMHGSIDKATEKLNKTELKKQFFSIYKTDTIAVWQVQNVLASYIRSLAVFKSKFDSVMRGTANFNVEERLGFNLFMGKAKCGSCHFMPLFNGTVPPQFSKTESEVLGVPADIEGKKLDEDNGRYRQAQMPQLKNSFKTPTVRNIFLTAPYMHNGVYKTLAQAMDFYNRGGGIGLGHNVENQTLSADKLNLTDEEMKAIITFMKTLTDI